jgi:uncharacterized protein
MPNEDQQGQAALDSFLDMWVTGTTGGRCAPVLRRPGEVGLEYEDVFFGSMDGVAMDGWFIPADSDKLIIHNHFLPEYKALHDAGCNILCYDIRNHGLSGSGNGGTVGIGLLDDRDVIGSVRYAKSRPDTASMTTFLLSVCLGGDSTCVAIAKHPEEFEHIKSLILLQPVSASYIIEEFVKANDIPYGYERFDKALSERTGFHLAEQSPLEYAKSMRVPTLVAQVHDDAMTRSEDVQSIYDAIPVEEKKLVWIEGTPRRFDGYNYFGEHPEVAIDWFNSHAA